MKASSCLQDLLGEVTDTQGATAEGLRIVRDAPLVGLALAMMEGGIRKYLRRDGRSLECYMWNLTSCLPQAGPSPAPSLLLDNGPKLHMTGSEMTVN